MNIQHSEFSKAALLALLPASQRTELLASLTESQTKELIEDWQFWSRPKQRPPDGDWSIWVCRCGRGWGKTTTGSHWVHKRAMEFPGRWIALVARNAKDARDYMIEGPGGIMRQVPLSERPEYEPSKRRLTWPNGSWATVYVDEEPEGLRGFSGDTAWLDEFGKYKNARETWDMLVMGMREVSSDQPRRLITTTPRPIKPLIEIEARSDAAVVTGSSYENIENLDPKWFKEELGRYEGTRLGRQELHAEILEDIPGALWQRDRIDALRVKEAPALRRIVVAIDPAATSSEDADESGIVVAGVDHNGHGYVLEDASLRGTPDQVVRAALSCFHRHSADRVIAEVNNGGEWIGTVVRNLDRDVPYKAIRASRGKVTRAEPVAALDEQGRIHHVGSFPLLEDQMCEFTTDWDRKKAGYSPDRVDARVWAFTELMGREISEPRIRVL